MVVALAHHQQVYHAFKYTLRTRLSRLQSTEAKLVCQDIVCCTVLRERGREAEHYWTDMADIEREGWLLMILSNGVMKGVNLLFV